ncbi:hypothetical protein PHYBLDRAFT_141686 [Phycomyces blakesleeanus NRRL 1555(-)]|uniref:Cas12f1-like TNB domain-containing protein n=2 Tax=Phycomyces blakesleeanus TaxID=4837 RepID=A0A162Y1A6_PHYB8|nr:hypothetical protein PHYBLDRAFT_141686 [Phycomyces blakesleeanus NRRL 1555(-)]OAD77825.1 hypothetical protein PHYBLDRAFT_141686 [Phycomyces blakesleeanus NRRL 1555(-)]|eukprot:XP_018295865.1 hypothetical protein PHYBLDRAFT_141686 [Phycomyces blakesleeanus NRRL 1555(-)]
MTNMLINCGSKYNKTKKVKKNNGDTTFESLTRACTKRDRWKPTKYQQDSTKVPLLVFGSGMFGKDDVKLKRHRCGAVGKLYKLLKKQEAEGQLIIITINEFKTSKTRSLCFFNDMKIIKTNPFKGVAVVSCKQCNKVWKRDSNAANNMILISKPIWSGEGRPDVFIPKKK